MTQDKLPLKPMPSPPITPAYLGINILAARTAKGMTQLALAHAIGWQGEDAGAQIAKYESGNREPKLRTLISIAEALGVPVEALLTPPIK